LLADIYQGTTIELTERVTREMLIVKSCFDRWKEKKIVSGHKMEGAQIAGRYILT